jgi:hypothetical protein
VTDIYRYELDVVEKFAEQVGEGEAILRSCDFMVAYLVEAAKPLPIKAARALRLALEYKNGSAALAELEAERSAMMRGHRWRREEPDDCAIEALDAVLGFYGDPSWGGGAGEVVSNFWALMEVFDRNEDRLLRLLKEYFGSLPRTAGGGGAVICDGGG